MTLFLSDCEQHRFFHTLPVAIAAATVAVTIVFLLGGRFHDFQPLPWDILGLVQLSNLVRLVIILVRLSFCLLLLLGDPLGLV